MTDITGEVWCDPVLSVKSSNNVRQGTVARTAISCSRSVIEPTSHQEHQGGPTTTRCLSERKEELNWEVIRSYLMSGHQLNRKVQRDPSSWQYFLLDKFDDVTTRCYRYDARRYCESVWGSVTALYFNLCDTWRDVTWLDVTEEGRGCLVICPGRVASHNTIFLHQ